MHLALRRRRTGIHHLAVRATRRMPSPSPGRRLKARAGGHRAVGNEWERLASAGPRGIPRLLPEVRCTWCGPLLYLVWTRDVPGVPFPLVLAVPGRRTAVLCKLFSRSRGTGLGGRGRLRLARGRDSGPGPGTPRWLPWSAESMSPAGAVCSRGSAARRARRGAGDGSTYTGKTWQPTGNGFAGHGPAGSLSVRSVGLRPPARCRRGRPPAGFRG